VFVFDAFFALSTERAMGMVEGQIPRSAIMAFAAEQGFDADEAEDFAALIRAMDGEYLSRGSGSAPDDVQNKVTTQDRGGVLALLKRLAGKKEGRP
jgi:hypothetical protein